MRTAKVIEAEVAEIQRRLGELGREKCQLQENCSHPITILHVYFHSKKAYKTCTACGHSELIETDGEKFTAEIERGLEK